MEQTPRLNLIVLPHSRGNRVDIVCHNEQTGMKVHFASWQTLINIMARDMPTRPIKAPKLPYNVSVRVADVIGGVK